MSEYWVSQGRRMCPYCKCWTADNKASINFHEQGKNHKENVKKKLDELRKKGVADAKRREAETSHMAKIEKAALESFKKDVAANSGVSSAYGAVSSAASGESTSKKETAPPAPIRPVKPKKGSKKGEKGLPDGWSSARTDDGQTYYYNSTTNETSWYPPSASGKATKPQAPVVRDKNTGYGQWQTIASEPGEVLTDYDLPLDSKNMSALPEDIPLPPDDSASSEPAPTVEGEGAEAKTKFKEKRVALGLGGKEGEPVAFKKFKSGKKRQTRGALDDD